MEINIEDESYAVIPKINLFPQKKIYCLTFNKMEDCEKYFEGDRIAQIQMNKDELKQLIKDLQGLLLMGGLWIKEESEVQDD